MSQICYNLEIVLNLLRTGNHIRGLAKDLKVNPMLISREISKLLQENVVDFEIKGRNKVYFLRKSVEAKNYIFMAESYKLVQILKKYPILRNIINKIDELPIKVAILFGSYAKGLAKKESDIDIYIETNSHNIKKELEVINSKINIKIGAYDKKSLLIKEIWKNHIVIKGVEEYYKKNGFFD